jgi:hypothetical protein
MRKRLQIGFVHRLSKKTSLDHSTGVSTNTMSENRELADEGLYASKYLASLANVYIPYMP